MNNSPDPPLSTRSATFFDVDGTLAATNIAHYYAYFICRRLPPVLSHVWYAAFLAKCMYYLLLDRINRSMCNRVFYRSYKGLPAADIRACSQDCHQDVVRPRQFQEVTRCVEEHRRQGREIVFVTGSIDFIVAPFAKELGVRYVLAPSLVEIDGRFTGDLAGPPVGEEEKARRVRAFAGEHGFDLSTSHGYGDSIADLPMLEAVGFPHAVNPDKALAATARRRGWPVLRWTLPVHEGARG